MSLNDVPTPITGKIADSDLHTDAWTCLNPDVLLGSAPTLGDNAVLDGVDGAMPRDFQDTERTEDLWFLLTGNVKLDPPFDGGPAATLAAVKRLFTAAFRRAERDANGCVTAEVTDVDGTEFEGPVQIRGERFEQSGLFECKASLTVRIPRGELQASGS